MSGIHFLSWRELKGNLLPGMLLAVVSTLGSSLGLQAQDTPQLYKDLRYEEDFTFLRDPAKQDDYFDPLKFIPLNGSGDCWLTLGGELQSRYECFHRWLWGQGPQDPNGYLLQRTMMHAGWHLNDSVRFFTQLKSDLDCGGDVKSQATIDEDRLDLNQAFVDVSLPAGEGELFTLRIGRQEMVFGSARLIVNLPFDGVRATMRTGTWKIDALAVEPVQINPGTFDDGGDHHQKLWGAYGVSPMQGFPGSNLDIYYLGLDRAESTFDRGTAREVRHSVGIRLWGRLMRWDYNCELVYQFGRFGSSQIGAWTVATDTCYTFAAPSKPRVGLKADVASGDRNPQGGTLGTFDALFPRGAYFNDSGLIGPSNFMDVHPEIEAQATETVHVSFDVDFLWRESVHDGTYGPEVNLLRSGQTSTARYIGSQPSIHAACHPSRHWTMAMTYAHFYAGAFIRQSGPGRDVDYLSSTVTFLF